MKARIPVVAALLLGSTIAMPAFAYTPGCPASQKTEAEGGAGGNWQTAPGKTAQKTEGEGGAGGNWQTAPGATAQKTEGEGGAGGNWQSAPRAAAQKTAAETQQASVTPCQ